MTVSLQHELRAYNVWEPDVTDPRPAWHATAACRGRTDWFHIDWVTTTEALDQLATIAGRPADRIAHGTNTGYYQHRRQGQPPCDRCREAHRLHEAGRTARAS